MRKEMTISYLKHIYTTIKHKYYLFIASFKVGKIPFWLILVHDLSKFSPSEFRAYSYHFHISKNRSKDFAYAWLHHQRHNSHHWEYWVVCSGKIPQNSGAIDGVFPMPEIYIREMVADWMAASKSQKGTWDISKWVSKNISKIRMHPESKKILKCTR
jgi:hypothetical protein